MSRRGRAIRRPVTPDPKYGSELVGRMINKLMFDGKKNTAQRFFYQALDIVEKRLSKPGIEVFEQAVRNITPLMEVRPRRVGGSTYQVPMEVPPERQITLAMRWLLTAARSRGGCARSGPGRGALDDRARSRAWRRRSRRACRPHGLSRRGCEDRCWRRRRPRQEAQQQTQGDAGDSELDYDAVYFLGELGADWSGFNFKLGLFVHFDFL